MKLVALPHFFRRVVRSAAGTPTLFAAMVAFLGAAPRSQGQIVLTSIWLSDVAPSPGNWSTVTNWTALLAPQSGYNVTINNGLIVTTVVNQDVDASIAALTLGPGATLAIASGKSLTVGASSTVAGTLRVGSSSTLALQAGTVTNTGTIEGQTGASIALSNATISGGNVTLAGTGGLLLSDATVSNVTLSNSSNGVVRAVSGVNTFIGSYLDAVGSQVRVDNAAKLSLQGTPATTTLNGGIYLNSTGSDTVLEIAVAGLTFAGAGQLTLSDNANNRVIGSGANAAVTFGPNFTVQGSGQVGAGLLGFTNQGAIIANQSNSLVVRPGAAGFSNTGTLRATNGATLGLSNGDFTNSGAGALIADNNSYIDVSGSKIVGGTLTSVGTGHFHALNSSTFAGVALTTGSNVEIGNGETLTLAGNIVNNGTFSLLSTGSSTDLKIETAVVLSGTGNLTLTDSNNNRIYAASGTSALTLGANQTLSGAGQLGRDTLTIANQGTILANGVNPLVVNNSGSTFTNAGALKATGTGGITLSDASVSNQGSLEISSGSTIAAAAALAQSGATSITKLSGGVLSSTTFALQEGTLTGTGTINGVVTTSGTSTIMPGGAGSIGTLTFNNTLTLGPNTGLYFDLGGSTAGASYDRINGTNVVLGGSLFLKFANGFQSSVLSTDSFTLINASTALSGTFNGVSNGSRLATADGLGTFQVNYLSNALTISNFQAIPEPSTWALIGLGSLAMTLAERRRRRRQLCQK